MDAIRTTEGRPRSVRLLVACGAAATLVGCAGAADGTGASTSAMLPAGSDTATQPDPLAPLGEPTTDPVETDGFPGSGEPALLTDVRVAGQDTFDRVVLEFSGPAPDYRVEYVEPPILRAGSGQPVELGGEAFLLVSAAPASGVDLSGEQPRPTYDGPTRLDPPYAEVVTEVVRTGDYESVLNWAIGLERQVPYGVVVLDDPTRLVVDVRYDSGPDGGDAHAGGDGAPPVGQGNEDVVDVADGGTGEPVVVTDVRLGAHDGFDRIVFELAGDGEAGYELGYVEDPTAQGSGEPIDVPGQAALGITLTNVLLPPDAPPGVEPWEQQDRLAIRDAQVVDTLVTDSLFEGRYAFYAGVTDRLPFAVERFENPQRLVVDVRTDRPGDFRESCSSPAGFHVGHPSDWAVNSGETVSACSRFAPSDFDVPEATDVRVAATAFSIEPAAFDRVTQERPGELTRDQLTVDGRDAVRIERETQDGLYPAGTPITSYAIELEEGESGPRTLVADTIGLPGFDYERNVEVLDAQVESLDLGM